jgi:signal transduction histidine kinase
MPQLTPLRSLTDGKPRLLIVDDEATNLLLLRRTFERECVVITCDSGQSALNALENEIFDAVLLDVMMPAMNGFEVLQEIRRRSTATELPVILVTAKQDSDDIVRGFEYGANDYITKPVNVDIVRARVQTQLQLKRLADENKRQIEELQIVQSMQDQFLRIVAHDLKGPLTNLRMAHYLLREMVGKKPDVAAVLDNVDTTLGDMHEMIRVFLDAATFQPGKFEAHVECFNADEGLIKLVEQYTLMAARKGIDIQYSPSDLLIEADPRLFSQVIGNLIGNAIKYAPFNTSVSLWTAVDDNIARVFVADQGPGIPASERGKLFTMFGRLSPRPTNGESSTGLGLWIVKTLAEAQGGRVGTDFPPDGGSIFYVEFPTCEL